MSSLTLCSAAGKVPREVGKADRVDYNMLEQSKKIILRDTCRYSGTNKEEKLGGAPVGYGCS